LPVFVKTKVRLNNLFSVPLPDITPLNVLDEELGWILQVPETRMTLFEILASRSSVAALEMESVPVPRPLKLGKRRNP